MLKGKCVVLGLTGSVAVYKSLSLIRLLVKEGCEVHTIMTKSAAKLINPYIVEELSQNRCVVDTFERTPVFDVKHISLANKADLFVIAPATANIIGKIANGIADDMLSTTVMATKAKKLIAPAMNTNMYENPIFQQNLNKLKGFSDYEILETGEGELACGTSGKGRMLEADEIFAYIKRELYSEKPLVGKKALVTCGATREAIDPVRFITNHSSGKMGFALAEACAAMGAEVTIVKGSTTAKEPYGIKTVNVKSAADMFEAVKKEEKKADYIFMAAAVADYTPIKKAENKIKKAEGGLSIELKRTEDILKYLGANSKAKICGFSMETEELVKNSSKKLESKNVAMIAANSLKEKGCGFGTDTNRITLITKKGVKELPFMSKEDCAFEIVKNLIEV